MDAKLIVVGGQASKDVISLKLPTVIGRSKEATLTIAHPLVSRRHCELFELKGLLMIRDKESLNGTMVGKQRIKLAPLPPNAEFSIGPLTFRVDYAYKGDLSRLPAPVLVEPAAADARSADSQATDESPIDFEAIGSPEEGQDGISLFFDDMDGEVPTASPAETPGAAATPASGSLADSEKPAEGDPQANGKKPKKSWMGGLLGGRKKAKKAEPAPDAAPAKPAPVAAASPAVPAPATKADATPASDAVDLDDLDGLFAEPGDPPQGTTDPAGESDDPFDEFLKEI